MHFCYFIYISGIRCPARCFLHSCDRRSAMSSSVLLSLLRRGSSTITRQTFITTRSSSETLTASGQVSLIMWVSVPSKGIMTDHTSLALFIVWVIVLQVGGAWLGVVGVRQASGSVRSDRDDSVRPVTWESFGIWDNRIEEPILLPSSIKYGKPIPQVTAWTNEWFMFGWMMITWMNLGGVNTRIYRLMYRWMNE